MERFRNNQPNLRITFDEEGFKLFHVEDDQQALYERRFDTLLAAHVYKVDLITTDRIECELSFVEGDEERCWIAHEDMEGFRPLMDHLARSPYGIGDWVTPVMLPPFQTNWTLIYRRPHLPPAPTVSQQGLPVL